MFSFDLSVFLILISKGYLYILDKSPLLNIYIFLTHCFPRDIEKKNC